MDGPTFTVVLTDCAVRHAWLEVPQWWVARHGTSARMMHHINVRPQKCWEISLVDKGHTMLFGAGWNRVVTELSLKSGQILILRLLGPTSYWMRILNPGWVEVDYSSIRPRHTTLLSGPARPGEFASQTPAAPAMIDGPRIDSFTAPVHRPNGIHLAIDVVKKFAESHLGTANRKIMVKFPSGVEGWLRYSFYGNQQRGCMGRPALFDLGKNFDEYDVLQPGVEYLFTLVDPQSPHLVVSLSRINA